MNYVVYFQWNWRGKAATEFIASCDLPDGVGPATVGGRGFWVDDLETQNTFKATYVDFSADSNARTWIPPGRITSILKRE